MCIISVVSEPHYLIINFKYWQWNEETNDNQRKSTNILQQ